jgi:signal transduction histidine kinase
MRRSRPCLDTIIFKTKVTPVGAAKSISMASIEPRVSQDDIFVLTRASPGRVQKLLAVGVVLVILVVAISISWPLAGIQLRPVEAFVPFYLTAMFLIDLITAVLLFAQFSILRTRALLIAANAYAFTALVMIPYTLAFPGVFEPGQGLIGGLQSSAWLYVFWHCGFALFVLGFALFKDLDLSTPYWSLRAREPIVLSLALTITVVLMAVFICIAGEALLPTIMLDRFHFGAMWPYFVGAPIAFLCICALIVLWIRRRTVLGLWLMVVMALYLVEVPLSYYPFPFRFSAGWYAVRVIGVISSSLVLIVLLYEISKLYARLLRAVRAQQREREARLMTGDAVAATIAHEVKQPLSAMITRAETGLRRLDRPTPDLNKVKEEFKQIATDGYRAGVVIDSIRANFKKDARNRTPINLDGLIGETIALLRGDLQRCRIVVQAESNRGLPPIMGDRTQLQQVLMNLVSNAIDSMTAKDGPRVLSIRSELRDEDGIVISVADTGTGIRSQDVERVFNPLFTTKSDGMGMGLSICRSIIEAHDGQLWVVPNAPTGAVFQFALRP